MNRKLIELVRLNNLQKVVDTFSVDEVIRSLEFKLIIKLSWRMLFTDYANFEQSEYGVDLLLALREFNNEGWIQDWRNDALLGVACENTYRYDDRYAAFMRAYERALIMGEGTHPGLLISLARCCHAPGHPLISYEDSLQLVLKATENIMYIDGAWALSGIYSSMGDDENHIKWKSIAEKLELENGELSPHIYPQFLWEEEIS